MTAAELNLAFAREVVGYPDAFWAGNYLDNGSAQHLPDYSKDWNAVIAQIEKRDLMWGADYEDGQKLFWCAGEPLSSMSDCKGEDCAALARAVLDCVRAMKVAERKYNRENSE